jgi:hypothetical protein
MNKIGIVVIAMVSAALLAGCSVKVEKGSGGEKGIKIGGAEEKAETAAPAMYRAPEGATTLGEEITVEAPVQHAVLKKSPADYFEKTILVEATAAKVCQSKGCWMTVTDGEGDPIWVRWSSGCGGQYAFPKDVSGKRVIVQGSIYEKEIDAAAAEHLAGETEGMDAEKIVGKTFEMNATAFVILPGEVAEAAASSG